MSEHDARQPTGPDRLQRRATRADLLTGAAVVLWLVPIGFVAVKVPTDAPELAVVLASTLALSAFVLSVAMRARVVNRRWRDRAAETAQRRHNELVAQIANNHMVLMRMVDHTQTTVDNGLADLHERVISIEGQLGRKHWDIYADAITDVCGGPEVVNGQDTHRLSQRPGPGNVVQFPQASNPSKNGRGF
jgi:hypothetical protein